MAGFRHVQHVRSNRGPHTLGAPTYGQTFFFVLAIFSIVVDSNYFMLPLKTECKQSNKCLKLIKNLKNCCDCSIIEDKRYGSQN